MFRRILIATGVLALAVPAAAYAAPDDPVDRFERSGSRAEIDSEIRPRSLTSATTVQVMVEVKGDPVAVVEAERGEKLSGTERKAVRDKLRKTQDKVAKTIASHGGKVKSSMQSAYNGMRVQIKSSQLDEIAAVPEVVAIRAVPIHTLDNAISVPYLGVPEVWQSTGYTGENIKVAIIDTGIDYTHANFAGPGTVAAFDAAHAAEAAPADPTLFGPAAPRVKGGWDFVGDSYDADPASSTWQPVPHPDPNPLDCNGHGSHVAGTTGGNGVLADGTTYAGPYDSTTAARNWRIGPGVAPEVDLYALRVFGCNGSTDVTTEAIDWAVAQDMDVINMSLGSSFGRGDDPSAVAASNAVGAGVVVVASAGNSGGNPYITGSPGTGDGVIAVSAVDSTETFPGALLSFGNGTSLKAIRSNNEALPAGALTVVVLKDLAGTPENESLGCSVAAYTGNGVSAGGGQLAAATRGTCARAAKAIYGQQAGAAAVLQINTDPSYPPLEGDITSNPDTGDAYEVTIPFLGVRSTDRPAIVAADGGSVTFTETTLDNPGYRGYGSFSSSGPRNGDSAISPNVAAPGVAIVSTGSGTGNNPATISGTSMAAPHVAGVAALAVQAHPKWDNAEIASALVTTSDPEKVAGQRLARGGVGLVDTAQAVSASVVVSGDPYRTSSGWLREPSLSFGFSEPSSSFVGVKTLTIENKGRKTVTYKLSTTATPESKPGKVRLSARSVTVKPGRTAKVRVTLRADASKLGSSSSSTDQFAFHEVSGNVVLTSRDSVLRVPYLLVPRARAKVTDLNNGTFGLTDWVVPTAQTKAKPAEQPAATPSATPAATPSASPTPTPGSETTQGKGKETAQPEGRGKGPWKPQPSPKPTPVPVPATSATIELVNPGGALDAGADFYTWGLKDGRDVPKGTAGGGFDLRAAGVQSFPMEGNDALLVFAVNNHDRWSNAVVNEFDVSIDTNGDGALDWIVFSFDYGSMTTGSFNGLTGVFLFEKATNKVYNSGLLAVAPTDSSTILLPVPASYLGITAQAGGFSYSVTSYSIEGTGTASDTFTGTARYNPWAKAIEDGQSATVEASRRRPKVAEVTAAIDPQRWAEQKPLGLMAVVIDNKAGSEEAVLIAGK